MSSVVISTSAAPGRPFIFAAGPESGVTCPPERDENCAKRSSRGVEASFHDPRLASITPASQLIIRPAPEMAPTGIAALDALTGGLPRGCLTELCGPASSGRTTVLLAVLAAATRRGEFCALIDASDSLDPHSTAATDIDLDRLLWVRCNEISLQKNSPQRHRGSEKTKNEKENTGCPTLVSRILRDKVGTSPQNIENSDQIQRILSDKNEKRQSEHRLEQVLRATDLLLESGGFGLIVLDLADLPPQAARRIPLTTWFRFRRAVEHKPTILLAIEQQPIAGSCSSLLLQLGVRSAQYSVLGPKEMVDRAEDLKPSHAHLFTAVEINLELTHSRLERKPARSIAFETKTAWAG